MSSRLPLLKAHRDVFHEERAGRCEPDESGSIRDLLCGSALGYHPTCCFQPLLARFLNSDKSAKIIQIVN